MILHIGLDVGSTTVKLAVLDHKKNIIYSTYERHFSDVKNTVKNLITSCYERFSQDMITIGITGSGGLALHKILGIDFIQEVIAASQAIKFYIEETDVAIELGGEDSKIIYLRGSIEQRMNSICAGGTGAFIDQMASLLHTDAAGLNELAKGYEKIYPIASRCGVFAKTDIQALINQGASKSDIAISVFQSVVNQTISNLACGRPIKGKVAFLGGPLYFLPVLKERFVETLGLSKDEVIYPKNSQLFVAIGAALSNCDKTPIPFSSLYDRIKILDISEGTNVSRLRPLFLNSDEYEDFKKRHRGKKLIEKDLASHEGPMYLGIDSGSTTSKLILISEENEILYSYYGSNKGKPLEIIIEKLREIYKIKNDKAYIGASGVTGYGEEFIKEALNLDFGEVETIAHLRAAQYFNPQVDFIIDIGGQDMKSMKISEGVIETILLNEACSSGCGSFLETFANSVNMTAEEFSKEALKSKNPVDLGSRCTVFMNSNVKQAQKEGANLADISAGLSYSVVKNAIQKVIKIRDPKNLGEQILVQGGTFLNDAVLRAFEIITDRQVTRPPIAGLMGALGMALISKSKARGQSKILGEDDLDNFSYRTKTSHCRQCTNNCLLSINIFSNGKRYITGNRCEKGAGISKKDKGLPNLYAYKYDRLFSYESLKKEEARRGEIGIPRVLNMYENYPFWHTFFTSLGYRVILSDKSSRKIYEEGMDSIISETACYPAKISHGHIENLISKNVNFIFYPAVFYEERAYKTADNILNCPVVAGYSEVIKNNVEKICKNKIKFLNPFISFENRKKLLISLQEIFDFIPKNEIKKAFSNAFEEYDRYKMDLRARGQKALEEIKEKKIKGIVLAGRPYHIDPEINHGIPELINSLGLAVISEDSIAHLTDIDGRLRVLDQWNYHSRLYRAAKLVGLNDNLELVQLNSFGCGLDAVTTDQVEEILRGYNKIYTLIKIDEVNNLAAVKIRLRSLLQAVEERKTNKEVYLIDEKPSLFTKEMRKRHTILLPQMAPIQFNIIASALRSENFNVELLDDLSEEVVNEGLTYVNNDTCYPAIFVVGQFIAALKSGKYDTDNLTLLITQTGGACRASNYVAFIRKAIVDAGFGHVTVLALSFQGIESHPGLKLPISQKIRIFRKLLLSLLYGDLLMRLSQASRPYEKNKGEVNKLIDKWKEKLKTFNYYSIEAFEANVASIVSDFAKLEKLPIKKNRVGIVGEILVKYHPAANNYLVEKLEKEGVEVVTPDLTDFMMYCFKNVEIKNDKFSKSKSSALMANLGIKYIEKYRGIVRNELNKAGFDLPKKIEDIMELAEEFVDLGNQYGEGWLLTGEMVELIEMGVENIICVQPFGCLPNHITGKGVIKAIRNSYPHANIVPIDFDASASQVNQFNRIKLMLSQVKTKPSLNKPIK